MLTSAKPLLPSALLCGSFFLYVALLLSTHTYEFSFQNPTDL